MANSNTRERLQQHIEELTKKLDAARHLENLLNSNPELASLLVAELEPLSARHTNKRAATRNVYRDGTQEGGPKAQEYFEKIANYLGSAGNEWKSTADITDATKLDRNAIVHIFYKVYPKRFEKRKSDVNSRVVEWRLKELLPESGKHQREKNEMG